MLGRTLVFTGLFLLSGQAWAQQLYVKNIDVYYVPGKPYCNLVNSELSDSYRRSYGLTVTGVTNPWEDASLIEYDQPDLHTSYPGGCLALCAAIYCVNKQSTDIYKNAPFGIDELRFEIFKYVAGANPLDTSSTPPIRTINVYNVAICTSNQNGYVNTPTSGEPDPAYSSPYYYCGAWDGSYNLDGEFAKTNGQFGYRATVTTNQTSETIGTINITHTAAFPGQNQYPVQMDVTNIHAVRSTPTVVGTLTPVATQPYNIVYRLSNSANVTITVETADSTGSTTVVRHIVNSEVRQGEGTPNGTLQNGDSWDGRNDSGKLLPAGVYLVRIQANSNDEWGQDVAWRAMRQISLDPLQLTDFRIKGITASSTDLATISYVLTESATVYVRIFSADTTFTDVNDPLTAYSGRLIRSFTEEKLGRQVTTPVYTVWDGRDSTGNAVEDGDYIYGVYAAMPDGAGGTIYTSKLYTGVISIARGAVTTSGLQPSSSVIGSSPTVTGLNPFYFRYTISRDASVDFNILTSTAGMVRHVVKNESRSTGVTIAEIWDGLDDAGRYVSSGTYMAELVVYDPLFPSKTTRLTSLFPVDLLRMTDIATTNLLGQATAQASVSFMPSQAVNITLRIYPPSTNIPTTTWPPPEIVNGVSPIKIVEGVRPGKYKVTEYWDGIVNTQMVADGEYPFVIIAKSTAPYGIYNTTSNTYTVSTANYAPDISVGKIVVARGPVYIGDVNIIPTVPTMSSSSDVVKLPPYQIEFTVTRMSSVTIQAISSTHCGVSPFVNNICRNITSGTVYDYGVTNRIFWDGNDEYGNYLPADAYTIRIQAYNYPNESLQPATTFQTSIDLDPFQVYDLAVTDIGSSNSTGVIAYQTSVPMKIAIQIFKPGTVIDSNGNPTPSIASGSLVKTIVGVRPQKTKIEESWDGTDRSFTQVPDGQYIFRIVNSTDTRAINSETGEISSKSLIADLRPYVAGNNLTVSHGYDLSDPCGAFQTTTSFFPNPLRVAKGKFRITRVPLPGTYTLSIYNLAGDLVYEKDFGSLTPSSTYPNYEFEWDRTNASGKKVARGIYFAVMEMHSTYGTRDVCQTVKKILLP